MKHIDFYVNQTVTFNEQAEEQFDEKIEEARRSKKEDVVDAEDVDTDGIDTVVVAGKKANANKTNSLKAGVDAEKNGTNGTISVDPPTDEDEARWGVLLSSKNLARNKRKLVSRFKQGKNFMVLGEAGWAKTDLIVQTAKEAAYTVMTVYLDKAVASDLGGIPVPAKSKSGTHTYQDMALPVWASYMLEHPDKKWLLFFDEMNQAAPDVLNALMPIVLKHEVCGIHFDNMIVGAAGNLAKENETVSDLNQPLEDRLKPIIYWETHTPEAWAAHFEWARKKEKYQRILDIIDKCDEYQEYWNSPRDITIIIYDWALANTDGCVDEPEDILEMLEACYWRELDSSTRNSRTFEKKMQDFAQYLYDWSENGGQDPKAEKQKKRGSKGMDQVDKVAKELVIDSLRKGYYYFSAADYPDGDNKKYVCTVENVIGEIFDPEENHITAEVLRKIVKEMEDSGNPPKYYTKKDAEAEAKKKGWLDPAE